MDAKQHAFSTLMPASSTHSTKVPDALCVTHQRSKCSSLFVFGVELWLGKFCSEMATCVQCNEAEDPLENTCSPTEYLTISFDPG